MRQLSDLLQVEKQFQNAVNLQLDYTRMDKITGYIPTTASVALLKRYLRTVCTDSSDKANILIGPYGKGKSHLLLVLLGILAGNRKDMNGECLTVLQKKIAEVDTEAGELIEKIWAEEQRFLPVIITNTSYDLNQAFLVALKEALAQAGLSNMELPSNYQAAVEHLAVWEHEYPGTYREFSQAVREAGYSMQEYVRSLGDGNREAYHLFVHTYPKLTSGGVFNPLISSEVSQIYMRVNDVLCEQYHFKGMYLIFDEFSKFIEGHPKDTIAADMKILQDMCELASSSREKQLHLTLVAHKSMREYGMQLDKKVQNAYRGVEGRLTEYLFVTSSQNNYELIGHAIGKKPEYTVYVQQNREFFQRIQEKALQVTGLQNLFSEEVFRRVLTEGCYPLLPMSAILLLRISEQAAQNERTLFTFIARDEANSLAEFIKTHPEGAVVTPDLLYDYFAPMFRQNKGLEQVHHQWLAAEYALEQTEDTDFSRLIKTMALLLMIQQPEEFPANSTVLAASLNETKEQIEAWLAELENRELIRMQRRTNTYVFCRNVGGVRIEEEIRSRILQLERRFERAAFLNEQTSLRYLLPKAYNQRNYITRYYRYVFMEEAAVFALTDTKALFETYVSDGILLCVLSDESVRPEKLEQKVLSWQDGRIVLLAQEEAFQGDECLKRLQAILSLRQDKQFIENNLVLEAELLLLEEDCRYELHEYLTRVFTPEQEGTSAIWGSGARPHIADRIQFQRALSENMQEYYLYLPRINHELINRRMLSAPIRKARQKIMEELLMHSDCTEYLTGTSPEATIYRAVLVQTGVRDGTPDENTARMFSEINQFFASAIGQKQSFASIFDRLESHPYGIRAGIIPIYLAYMISQLNAVPCIYLHSREVAVDGLTMQLVSERPEEYTLYIEAEEAAKVTYLQTLAELFSEENVTGFQGTQMKQLAAAIQIWHQGLPQYARTFLPENREEQKELQMLRKLLRYGELNPRELLFEQFPKMFGVSNSYEQIAARLGRWKCRLDEFLQQVKCEAAKAVKELIGAGAGEDLFQSLQMWCLKHENCWKQKVLSGEERAFVDTVMSLYTHDEVQIVNQLSKAVLGLYIENWNDGMPEQFKEHIRQIIIALSQQPDEEESRLQPAIVISDENGESVTKRYVIEEDSSMEFLRNALENTLEEFTDVLTENQKINVLAELLKKLM